MHIEVLIKDVRNEKNVTLSGLARRSGVSVAHLSDIEKERKSPSLLVMVRVAKALDVPITDLYRVKWWFMEAYSRSLEELKLYLKIINEIPNERMWNKYAKEEKCLSSKSLEYCYGENFNKMCRKLIKEVRAEKKNGK